MDSKDEFLVKSVQPYINEQFKRFNKLWIESGLTEDIIKDRNDQLNEVINDAIQSFQDTFNSCYQDEIKLKDKLVEEIEEFKVKIDELSRRLNINSTKMVNEEISDDLKIFTKHYAYRRILKQIENIKIERLNKLNQLKVEEYYLCDLLDEDSYYVHDGSIIDENDLDNVKNHIISLGKEKDNRFEFIKNSQLEVLNAQKEFDFEIADNSSLASLVSFNEKEVPIDNEFMNQLKNSLNKMHKYRENLKNSIEDLKTKINEIWIKFDLRNEDLYYIMKINTCTYNKTILNKLTDEYNRCLHYKNQNMISLINKMRENILEYWNKMYFSNERRAKFTQFYVQNINDDIFDSHEEYLKKLEYDFNDNEQIYSLISIWIDKWSQYMTFDREYSDPNRFKLRTYSALTEERERNKYDKELPKIEAKILKLASETKTEIMIYDLSLSDYFAHEKSNYIQLKEELKKERQSKKEQDSKILTPRNRKLTNIQNQLKSSGGKSQSPCQLKRLFHNSPLAANKLTKTDSKSSLVVKRNLFSNSCAKNYSTSSLNRRPLTATTLNDLDKPNASNTKRRSIKLLNEKFKRRSKHMIRNNFKENTSNGSTAESATSTTSNEMNFNINDDLKC